MADALARRDRIVHIAIDDGGAVRAPHIESERTVAIFDLVADNTFRPVDDDGGPYHLCLTVEENRLRFDVHGEDGSARAQARLPMSPIRKIITDYFTICDSYYEAIRTASRARIEAIDMGRRGLHDEGAEQLRERLEGKIELDFETARRLFTLICALHIRGTER